MRPETEDGPKIYWEHHPSWLNKGPTKNRQTRINTHLTESDHLINTNEAFCLVYTTESTRKVKGFILPISVKIATHLSSASLWSQKQQPRSLNLAWASEKTILAEIDPTYIDVHYLSRNRLCRIYADKSFKLILTLLSSFFSITMSEYLWKMLCLATFEVVKTSSFIIVFFSIAKKRFRNSWETTGSAFVFVVCKPRLAIDELVFRFNRPWRNYSVIVLDRHF